MSEEPFVVTDLSLLKSLLDMMTLDGLLAEGVEVEVVAVEVNKV